MEQDPKPKEKRRDFKARMESWNLRQLEGNKKGYLAGGILCTPITLLAGFALEIYGSPFLQNGPGPDGGYLLVFLIALGVVSVWVVSMALCFNRYRKISRRLKALTSQGNL
jgi:hypothetical protein